MSREDFKRDTMATDHVLKDSLHKLEAELSRVMTFWLRYSHDDVHGGFHNCIYEDGRIYDHNKFSWLQGRQVWMYCRLYNECERYQKDEILRIALKGAEFLKKYVKRNTDGRCYFSVTADGKPIKLQRTIFSECFYVLAFLEVARATKSAEYKDEAVSEFRRVIQWVNLGDMPLGNWELAGSSNRRSLAVPLMILTVANEICRHFPGERIEFDKQRDWAVQTIKMHLVRESTVVLETVACDGSEIEGSVGRLVNPGHVIEAGWLLLEYAVEKGDNELQEFAIEKFITSPFELGWDKTYGGLFYFLDVDGYSPIQLEWNLKLWWPQCEAMIAFLMAFQVTKQDKYFEVFLRIVEYVFAKFPDFEYGEWFGYLSQKGSVTHNFKGGPFKGCFHIPRALHMCCQMLKDILHEREKICGSDNVS